MGHFYRFNNMENEYEETINRIIKYVCGAIDHDFEEVEMKDVKKGAYIAPCEDYSDWEDVGCIVYLKDKNGVVEDYETLQLRDYADSLSDAFINGRNHLESIADDIYYFTVDD